MFEFTPMELPYVCYSVILTLWILSLRHSRYTPLSKQPIASKLYSYRMICIIDITTSTWLSESTCSTLKAQVSDETTIAPLAIFPIERGRETIWIRYRNKLIFQHEKATTFNSYSRLLQFTHERRVVVPTELRAKDFLNCVELKIVRHFQPRLRDLALVKFSGAKPTGYHERWYGWEVIHLKLPSCRIANMANRSRSRQLSGMQTWNTWEKTVSRYRFSWPASFLKAIPAPSWPRQEDCILKAQFCSIWVFQIPKYHYSSLRDLTSYVIFVYLFIFSSKVLNCWCKEMLVFALEYFEETISNVLSDPSYQ